MSPHDAAFRAALRRALRRLAGGCAAALVAIIVLDRVGGVPPAPFSTALGMLLGLAVFIWALR